MLGTQHFTAFTFVLLVVHPIYGKCFCISYHWYLWCCTIVTKVSESRGVKSGAASRNPLAAQPSLLYFINCRFAGDQKYSNGFDEIKFVVFGSLLRSQLLIKIKLKNYWHLHITFPFHTWIHRCSVGQLVFAVSIHILGSEQRYHEYSSTAKTGKQGRDDSMGPQLQNCQMQSHLSWLVVSPLWQKVIQVAIWYLQGF